MNRVVSFHLTHGEIIQYNFVVGKVMKRSPVGSQVYAWIKIIYLIISGFTQKGKTRSTGLLLGREEFHTVHQSSIDYNYRTIGKNLIGSIPSPLVQLIILQFLLITEQVRFTGCEQMDLPIPIVKKMT